MLQVLGQYIENLMSASSVFQATNAPTKKRYRMYTIYVYINLNTVKANAAMDEFFVVSILNVAVYI